MFVNTMPRGTDISKHFIEANFAAYQSGKGLKTFSKLFGDLCFTARKFILKRKVFKTITILPRSGAPSTFTPRSDSEIQNNPRATSQTQQASLIMLNVKVSNSRIKIRLIGSSVFGGVARRKPPPSEKTQHN